MEDFFGSPYHLQSQGSVEAYSKVIQNFLIFIRDFTKDEFGFEEWMSFYHFIMHSEKNILQD